VRQIGLAGSAGAEFVDGVRQLRPEDAMVEAMLRGWHAQQAARGLRAETIGYRQRLVRRFAEFTNEYPWQWRPAHVDEWTLSLTAEQHLAPSTIRNYQIELRLFNDCVCDARYGWAAKCEAEFGPGVHPVPICHEWNTIAHLNEYEGDPEARPFTRQELQQFLDYADEQVERAARARRKGALAAYRDATMFKVIYAWGLRRTETAKLDLADWGRNPAAPEFGRFGMLHVRYGKAVRRQPPRRPLGDGLGCRRRVGLRQQHPAAVRAGRSSGVVGHRARRPAETGGDQRTFRDLPGCARAAQSPYAAQSSPLLGHTPDRGRSG
jgi:integrase/recombinase XerC